MSDNIQIERQDDIAVVTLKAADAPVNILNAGFLDDLERKNAELAALDGIRAVVVISGQPGGFIAGADINAIGAVDNIEEGARLAAEGQRVLGLWSRLEVPVVAAIHGHCMGGGTEFALACSHRIAAGNVAIALPEVKLGIFPGFGGTQRLPRLISLQKSLDMILTGRTVRAPEALASGLVDRLADDDNELLPEAVAFARELAVGDRAIEAERSRKRGGLVNLLLEGNPLGRKLLFSQTRKQVRQKTGGHYPAPFKAIEIIEATLNRPLEEGLALEARGLGEMIVTDVCKNLVHIFNLSQRPGRVARELGGAPEINTAAVLGAGVMGGGIAQLLADKGIVTTLRDINQDALDAGMEHARSLFRRKLRKRPNAETLVDQKMTLLNPTLDYSSFRDIDIVIEAVVEKMEIKKSVIRETEEQTSSRTVIASNTSALSISELQTAAGNPKRVGGMHFFNPVDKMPLIEVIRGEQTAPQTVAAIFNLAQKLGKTPIITADSAGFLVNRLLGTYLIEAALIAAEGVNWLSIDRLMTSFGYPMGPFRLVDEVGIDIASEVGETLCSAFPHLERSPLLGQVLDKGLVGRKGGKGFYNYRNGHSEGVNLEMAEIGLEDTRTAGPTELKRLLYLMANEAGRCLDEQVVAEPEDVDTGLVFGTGFPPFRGGLCRWADREGIPEMVKILKALASQKGERFAPCDNLQNRTSFYA